LAYFKKRCAKRVCTVRVWDDPFDGRPREVHRSEKNYTKTSGQSLIENGELGGVWGEGENNMISKKEESHTC